MEQSISIQAILSNNKQQGLIEIVENLHKNIHSTHQELEAKHAIAK
jgi:hypothetical protein